jgi:beta-N-acetylhexosaminidase
VTDLPLEALFCFGFEGTAVPDPIRSALAAGLGGVILFRRNVESPEQLCVLTGALHAASARPLLIGVDQEGGRVLRLPPPFLAAPPAAALGRADDPSLTERLARAVGRELRAVGITWNLAPVLDVRTNAANTVIGDRAYGADPERVTRHGLAAIRGFAEAGILATAKHFPGHGDTAADSHTTLPESGQSATRWRTVEFVPFRRAIQAAVPLVLVAHLLCPGLDPELPSSLSRATIGGVLREELAFTGVVVSDDLEMAAIAGRMDVGEAAVRFFEAGGDLALICHDPGRQQSALAAVRAAVRSGRLAETRVTESIARITRCAARLPGLTAPDLVMARGTIGSQSHGSLLADLAAITRDMS